MSRVFVARETALGRTVVLKVLPPDLAASLSVDRFRREIQVAARLQHPHIVPLLSAGEAGGYLYYTMPFVEGESLRERLARQGELPVSAALRILEQVTRALSYAHRHGVIHRDIKPDNILLSEGEALVADFGIAKAVAASQRSEGADAPKDPLTSVGVALGTPLYMAPEQAAADPTVDARADLYALGVVAYEMLAGQPPFQGRTAAQLLAAHAAEQPVAIRSRRPSLSPVLSDLIMRLLEKRPADRIQSADELLSQLDGAQTAAHSTPTVAVAPAASPARASATAAPRRGRWLVGGGLAALGLGLVVASLSKREPAVAVDRSVVAVVPFRVSSADSSLGYLREGMVDLLAAKLSGAAGIRAANPRTLLSVWRRMAGRTGDLDGRGALQVANRVGAGRLIQGDIVGSQQQLTINAELIDAATGQTSARASVVGPGDSLPRLVDQLAGKLLALQAGENEQRLASLTSTSLPALRAYLDGQSLVRNGKYRQAAARFDLALQHDSTFALAGLGLNSAGLWFGQQYTGRGSRLAWRYRDKLAPTDRALLDVYLGDRWPAPRRFRSGIAAAERYVQVEPDNAEAWFLLADNIYHWGAMVGIDDAHQRAGAGFQRAQALDSTFAPVWEHASTLALQLGDTAGAQRALRHMLRVDSTSALAVALEWELAMATGDSVAQRETLRSDSLPGRVMLGTALSTGLSLGDVERVLRRNYGRAATAELRDALQADLHAAMIIAGRPTVRAPLPESWPEPQRVARSYLEARLVEADSAAGDAAGRLLEAAIGTPLQRGNEFALARFAGGQYAFDRGRTDRALHAAADLRRVQVPPDSTWLREVPQAFALILESEIAAARRAPELPRLLGQLDSALLSFGGGGIDLTGWGNLLLARLSEREGNLPRALSAIRRRAFELITLPVYVTYHREEGRLAALNGDREGAIRAYRRFLGLRDGAEPSLQPLNARVRSELEALQRESTDR